MKLYIKNLILFCSLVSVLTSCDLDVVPPAEISAENFWKTEKDAWYALNGCYQSMPAVDIWIMRIVINRGKGIWKWFNKMALIRRLLMEIMILMLFELQIHILLVSTSAI